MNRLRAGLIGISLFTFQTAFSQVAPVKHLAGKFESGQPHLYWFGAAAVESTLAYDDGVSYDGVFVMDQWYDNQALVRFQISTLPFLVTEVSAYIHPPVVPDTSSRFALALREGDINASVTSFVFLETLSVRWTTQTPVWVSAFPKNLLLQDIFRASLHWLSGSPTNPRLGHQRIAPSSGNSFVGWAPSGQFELYPFSDGNLMIRVKVLVNNLAAEAVDSFWIYRAAGSGPLVHVATTGRGQFDYLDSPPGSDNYYYQVSRWVGQEESPPSNLIGLAASPTAVDDRQLEKLAFLLSEPFPNPTSTGVLFTARTDKQMELGFSVYNLLGQKVFSKPAVTYTAGEHQFFWNGQTASGNRLPSGIYFLRFQAGDQTFAKKITLLH